MRLQPGTLQDEGLPDTLLLSSLAGALEENQRQDCTRRTRRVSMSQHRSPKWYVESREVWQHASDHTPAENHRWHDRKQRRLLNCKGYHVANNLAESDRMIDAFYLAAHQGWVVRQS